MNRAVTIPTPNGALVQYTPRDARPYKVERTAPTSRTIYAAVHVVADALAPDTVAGFTPVDWEATMAYRHHIWSCGLGVAEAMDTAQRGMELSWPAAKELIARSLTEAHAVGGSIVCGVQTDQLPEDGESSLAEIEVAYLQQCEHVENNGGQVVLMASPQLASTARSGDDYLEVYSSVLSQLSRPALIHWLGGPFDARMAAYWGSTDLDVATSTILTLLADHSTRIEGIKLSLLDQRRELQLRAMLPSEVRMFTGDDFNYPTTIEGDGQYHSHALLGAFDGFAPAAAAAIRALDQHNAKKYRTIMESTLPLSRHVFESPTKYYKTGLVFLAFLNGFQDHFRLLGGLESARSTIHLARVFVLAGEAGLLYDVERAAKRAREVLSVYGVDQAGIR